MRKSCWSGLRANDYGRMQDDIVRHLSAHGRLPVRFLRRMTIALVREGHHTNAQSLLWSIVRRLTVLDRLIVATFVFYATQTHAAFAVLKKSARRSAFNAWTVLFRLTPALACAHGSH